MPRSPQAQATGISSTGYKRSPSVTAAVDFFEQRTRSASASSLADKARSSPRTSPRPSVSAEPGPGPSSQTSPRLRASGLPRGVSAQGRSVTTPHISGESRSGRSSVDSTASSSTKPPVGLGVRGVGAGEHHGTRRASETAVLARGGGLGGTTTTASRLRQPQTGPRPSLSSESTASPQKPSAAGMRRTGTSSSQEAGPSSRTTTPPRNTSTARQGDGPQTPSPRHGASSTGTLGSPRRTPISTASRIPTRTPTRTLTRSSPSQNPPIARSPAFIRPPLAPTLSISHPTPEGSRIPKSASSGSIARSMIPNGSSNASGTSIASGFGSNHTPYRLSPAVRSHSHSSLLSSAHSSGSLSSRGAPNRADVIWLDTEDEKELPPLPAGEPEPARAGPPVKIPKRYSSAASPVSPTSPTMPSTSILSHNGPPVISPRLSSKHAFEDDVVSPPIAGTLPDASAPAEPARLASENILLGEEVSPNSRQQLRLGLGLRIEPPPPLSAMRLGSSRPSPPIPAKSPLRSLSRASSIGRTSSGISSRIVSRESTFDSVYGDDDADPDAAITTATTDSTAATDDSTTAVVGRAEYDARDSLMEMPTSADIALTPQMRYFDPSADPDTYGNEDSAKRLTTLTYASAYSQDSSSPSARAVGNMGEFGMSTEGARDGERRVKRQSRMNDLWGKSNRSSPASDNFSPTLPAPLTTILPQTQTDSPESSALNTATTTSDISRHAITGHSPGAIKLEIHEPPRPVRSPSVPMLNAMGSEIVQPSGKAAKLLGIDSANRPSRSNIPAPLLPSAMTRSPTAPVLSPRTPSSVTSKRTHLLREITNTERAFATDLALVCGAYLGQYLRPTSASSAGESASESSRRGSTATATDNRQSSGTEWSLPTPPGVSPFPRSPSEGVYSGGQGYFTSASLAATASTTSLKQPSPAASSGRNVMMGPPVGKPLSPADARTVFLNLEQLAAGAEEMARGFEGAMGEEEAGPGPVAREGEGGTDRLGEVFMNLIPRLQSVYHYYCSRQESASSRLQELLSDPSTAAHLNGCWAQVKPHTHAWNLDSMLIKPVQRITKYPLLFEDLLACTTPVHPDYFNIRAAAELSRKIAVEIDEAKRRKDVVANAISTNKKPKTPKSTLPSPAKDKKGLKMFRKEKLPVGMSPSASSVNLSTDAPPEITTTSFALLKDLVARVDEGDQVARRMGKEVILWTAGSKEMIVAEGAMMTTWARVVRLDPETRGEDRVGALQAVLDVIVRDVWAALNDEIRDHVMPIFSKLLETVVNPRKVIVKHQAKQTDYLRYSQLIKAKRTPDRLTVLSALDFYALHSQLLDELPAFLEGYMRILDLALRAFAAAQARYYYSVKTRLDEFATRWIARPRQSPRLAFAIRRASEDGQGVGSEDMAEAEAFGGAGGPVDLTTGRGIVKAWHDAWAPYADAMEHFQCTRPAKAMVSRIASFNARTYSRPSSRPSSRVASPAPLGPTPARPGLHHSVSFTSRSRNSSGSLQLSTGRNSAHARSRSTSLLGSGSASGSGSGSGFVSVPLPSPIKESRFNPFRSGSKTPKSAQPTPRSSRPSSLHIPSSADGNTNRYSFGLPRMDQAPGLDGLGKLGVSPTNRLRMSPAERPAALGGLSGQDVAEQPAANGASGGGSGPSVEVIVSSDPAQFVPEEVDEDSPSFGRGGRAGTGKSGTVRTDQSPAAPAERPERPERPSRPESRNNKIATTDTGVPFPTSPPRRRSSAATAVAGLGLGDVESHPVDPSRRTSGRSVISTQSTSTSPTDEPKRERTDRRPVRAYPAPPPSAFPATAPSREKSRYTVGSGHEIDASEGWRGEPVLYQCGCVADFDPVEIGDKRYRGLRFLPMVPGDLFDVFHEVGRIDELPKFPYPEVGVDNDGVLVGRAEDGAIGLLICSFLEPLRD